jgi:hypothetical protein
VRKAAGQNQKGKMLSAYIRTASPRMLELEVTEADALDLFHLVELLRLYRELPPEQPDEQVVSSEAP